jgi:hypothetical protein
LPLLQLDFQAGFSGDTVVVGANGRELLRREGVSTDYSIGRADSARVEVPGGWVKLKISLPARGLSAAVAVDATATPHLAISVAGDRIEPRMSPTPFEYF